MWYSPDLLFCVKLLPHSPFSHSVYHGFHLWKAALINRKQSNLQLWIAKYDLTMSDEEHDFLGFFTVIEFSHLV